MEWVLSKTTNLVTYGKRRTNQSSSMLSSSNLTRSNTENFNPVQKPVVFDFSSVDENKLSFANEDESSSGKRVKQERSGLKEIESKSAFTKSKPTAKNLKKIEENLKNAISKGSYTDIEFLIHNIDEHNAGLAKAYSPTHFLLTVNMASFDKAHKKSFTEWLDTLGFQNNPFGTICLPLNEIDLLFKLLKNHQASVKTTASTPVSLRSKSSSYESLPHLEMDTDGLTDSFITAEKLEDVDRRHKANRKAGIARKRSISNPQSLTINTGLDFGLQPNPPMTSTSLQMINPSTMGSGSNSNGSRRYITFPKRKSSDADDISERGAESPYPDTFSPIGANRSRSGSCRNHRSVSPLETSLMDSLRDKMTFTNGSTGSSSASHDENEDSAVSGVLCPSAVTNLFSTMKESALGLHSIEEDEEEQPATQQDDGHDSDAPTERDEVEEEMECDEQAYHHEGVSFDDSVSATTSPRVTTLESQSFFSPSCGSSRPPFMDFSGRPSFPPDHHGISGGDVHHRKAAASLFNAPTEPVMRMPPLFIGGGGGTAFSCDDDLGNLSELRRAVGSRADDTLLRNDRAQKKNAAQQNKLNQFCRSHTEPLAYSYSAAVAEGTPVQDRTHFSQPNPSSAVFNTPQAVFRAKWEDSHQANVRCIWFLLNKIQNISGSTQTQSPYYPEQAQTQQTFVLGIASGGQRSTRPSTEMDFFSMSGVELRSSLSGPHSDEIPEYATDHCPINSLVSSRPSFGIDENARHSSLLSQQQANPPTGCIANARISLFRRVTSCNSSLASLAEGGVNMTSPVHHVLPTLSFQESPLPLVATVTNAQTKKQIKEKKSACKQRRMSRAVGGRSAVSTSKNVTADDVAVRALASTFSPFAKTKSNTSTRSRRRQSAIVMKQKFDDSVVSEALPSMVDDDEENDEFPAIHDPFQDQFSVLNETAHQVHVGCQEDEQVFDGIVMGGSYQHCFEDGAPVVCAPGASDKRITDLQLSSNNNLVLSMYLPKDRVTKSVDLGREWQWRRVSPCGYLVSKAQLNTSLDDSFLNESVQRRAQSVCYYYLAKHPNDWMVSSLHKPSREQRSSLDGVSRLDSDHFCGEDMFNSSMMADDEMEDPCMEVEDDHDVLFRQDSHDTTPYNDSVHHSSSSIVPSRQRTLSKSLFQSDESMNTSNCSLTDTDDLCFTQLTQLDVPGIDSICLSSEEEIMANEKAVRSAGSMHCMNASLMSMVLSYLVDPTQKTAASKSTSRKTRKAGSDVDFGQLQTVCKAWALGSYMLTAQRLSDFAAGRASALKYDKWSRFVSQYSWGKFLSEGVCKSVFCVQGPSGSLEAVSIMDVDDLADRDMEGAVTQELQISILCSALVSLHICPNLVQVYSMFQAEYAHPESLWDGSVRPTRPASPSQVTVPKKSGLKKGNFQFIRMEFCSGGDAEELVRKHNQLSVQHTRQFLFQMCFALYTCREQISLRHFDIKLLNFFVTKGVDALPADYKGMALTKGTVDMRVGFGQNVYGLALNCDAMDLLKLADFGTSAVGHECLGDPITLQQFTTLENTPPEFLISGSAARQCFSADTFSLGLCFLHLLTGFEPYEELLKDVRCPKYLMNRLQKIWRTDDVASPFYVVGEVLDSMDDAADEQDQEGTETADSPRITEVLYDTLYRYMVMFGLSGGESVYSGNPVWTALCDSLGLGGEQTSKKMARGKADSVAQYMQDSELWSVRTGQHQKMKSLRMRLSALGDSAAQLLESMTHFDPSMRCSMNEALNSPVFACMRLDDMQHAPVTRAGRSFKPSCAADGGDVRYMHYYRGGDGVCDDLPIV